MSWIRRSASGSLEFQRRCLRAACTTLSFMISTAALPAAAQWTEISGFRIDLQRVPESLTTATTANLLRQIGIVEAAALPDRVLSFFRSVPIVVDPTLDGMNGQQMQMEGTWAIRARPGSWPADRAILLHELLHTYHREVLGRSDPAIRRFHAQAIRPGVYPHAYETAYFLSNPAEYFAVIGEIFLAGDSYRPPFTCGAVKAAQRDFVQYLATLFGEHECR